MQDIGNNETTTDHGGGPTRRVVLGSMASALAICLSAGRLSAQAVPFGPAEQFSFDALVARAREAADRPFVPAVVPAPDLIDKVDYDAHWKIRYREDATLYPAGKDSPVQLFHPGRFFPQPVRIYLRNTDKMVREVEFSEDVFDMPADSPAHALPPGFGYAGFRVMRPDLEPDWVSFLGASYFRTDGPEHQYGLSARGLAVNTGLSTPEEFPRFTAFWLGPSEQDGEDLSVWAMLDSPSVTGAYDFGLTRGAEGEGHKIRVAARLFMREDVERLGIAPLTSMYWYSERDRIHGDDWRPEIHDSDGLALATGTGERIWRPLDNPPHVTASSFFDDNPHGFGLIQRDRDFENYQDDGVFYNKRPSVWVKPLGEWGRGAVQLVEIPTGDETFDNIVAYWVPETQAVRGQALSFDYEIDWVARDPMPENVASVVSTRQGRGGIPGQPLPEGVGKMAIDFAGDVLKDLDNDSGVEPVIEATNGQVLDPIRAFRVVGTDRWRLVFDFSMEGAGPVSLRAYLRRDGVALTETWIADAWTTPGA
ncbi:MAG: glucan biosynthesis protein [Rhodobacteraceae bacterium]|nr:glucan biosynthesis protein [Paracoccaceae bacterium]